MANAKIMKASSSTDAPTYPGRPVLITTEYRGVFFGYAEDTSGDTVILRGARNCIYWSAKTGGFLGLASRGPGAGSRIGARIDRIELRKVTSVADVTPRAVEAWNAEPTYVGSGYGYGYGDGSGDGDE